MIDDRINTMLSKVTFEPQLFWALYKRWINPKDDSEAEALLKIMREEKGLIKYARLMGEEVILTHFGDQVKRAGGWIRYNESIHEEKVNTQEVIKQEKAADKRRFKITTAIACGALVISGISIAIDFSQGGNTTALEKVQERQAKKIDSLSKVTTSLLDLSKTKSIQKPDSLAKN